ncbi:hypothetical protein RhiirA5_435214 [Rhizophagus irregularis]|uniref:Uncharacterized protein n=1 Tax=Rhizophagus irregularis TaxID=588596 RepID=A0A2N0NNR4_9GLOM|nr:hypothetical protein RhiirA5_435214 [Rhizophagus irregularis]
MAIILFLLRCILTVVQQTYEKYLQGALGAYFAYKNGYTQKLEQIFQQAGIPKPVIASKNFNRHYIIHLMALTDITKSDEGNFPSSKSLTNHQEWCFGLGDTPQKLQGNLTTSCSSRTLGVIVDHIVTEEAKKEFTEAVSYWICKGDTNTLKRIYTIVGTKVIHSIQICTKPHSPIKSGAPLDETPPYKISAKTSLLSLYPPPPFFGDFFAFF